jgi:beta-glucosidase
MRRKLLGVAFLLILPGARALAQAPATPAAAPRAQAGAQKPAYLDTSLPIERRVEDLVSRMTLEEKALQMQSDAPGIPRLGIPPYNWWNEALHGVARAGTATVFPQAIGLAASWDTDLLQRVAGVISTEARAKYNDALQRDNHGRYFGLTFWSPNINIFRDPRWGRGQETYGEDPFLTARLGAAFVTGMQGDDPRYLKTVSTPKHYAVHSGPEVLRHTFDVNVSLRDFADTYTPAFRATIVEAKAGSVMCAYNSVRGAPACASPLLFDTLRKQWGFAGYVVSDCGAVYDINHGHAYVTSPEQAAALAVKAGTHLTCGTEFRVLPFAVRDRLLSMGDMDRAVLRLFTARFRLGMFDPPEMVPWSKLTLADNDTPEHRQLALQAARESIVLLKNADNVLPLKAGVKTIAVVGPTADSLEVLLGNYNGTPSRFTTILQGIRARFRGATILSAPGSALTETAVTPVPPAYLRTGGAGSQPGLKAQFFGNRDLAAPAALESVDAQVNFTWDTQPPTPALQTGNFSARWTGELLPPRDGEYRLGVSARGGFRLSLDGKLLADDWSRRGETTATSVVTLQAGRAYSIVLEYSSSPRGSFAKLVWNAPGISADAVEAAKKADVVVAVVGITPQLESEEDDVNAPGFFGGDRVDLDLPHPQQDLLEALAATGKPLIVVFTSGSALAVNWAQEHSAAILEAWYPGEEGGAAVGDVLSGDYNPAGRLPITFYASVAQLPPFTDYSMDGRTYRYFAGAPLYPFGFGLSYTSFAYSNARVDRDQVAAGDPVTLNVDVQNTGGIAGDEVVELYVTHPGVAGAPLRALAAFQRVHLERGEKKTVKLTLTERELSLVDAAGKRRVVAGPVEVWVGGGQPVAGRGQKALPGARLQFQIIGERLLPD